jgi:hypothetical protein
MGGVGEREDGVRFTPTNVWGVSQPPDVVHVFGIGYRLGKRDCPVSGVGPRGITEPGPAGDA